MSLVAFVLGLLSRLLVMYLADRRREGEAVDRAAADTAAVIEEVRRAQVKNDGADHGDARSLSERLRDEARRARTSAQGG